MSSIPLELQNLLIWQMMNQNGNQRPTAAELLPRLKVLNDGEKKLITEQNKAASDTTEAYVD
jgi:hypothetical protein